MNKIGLKTLSMAALLVVVCGCTTYRMEPKVAPKFVPSYKVGAVQSRLGSLPVRLNLDDCVEMTALAWRTMTGRADREPPFKFRAILERECKRMIADNFTSAAKSDRQTAVELQVVPSMISIMGESGAVTADITFSVTLVHPFEASLRPYFSRDYAMHAQCKDRNDEEIPPCVYETVQKMLQHFANDVGADRALLATLEKLLVEDSLALSGLKLETTVGGEQCRGSVSVDCKDRTREQTLIWAQGQIGRKCQEALRASDGGYRVFYATKAFADESKRWYLAFDAALSADFVVVRDGERRGRCFADLARLGTDRRSAPREIRRKLLDIFRGTLGQSVEVEIEDVRDDADNEGIVAARYRISD